MARANDTDVEALMNAQLMDPDENRPMPEPEPTQWVRTSRHFFRTDPGNRSRAIRIPSLAPILRGDDDGKKAAFFQRRFEKKYTQAERDRFQRVIEANNEDVYIRFKPIPNHFEGYFETESDVVASYVDELIAKGDLPFAYRDTGKPSDIKVTMPTHRAAAAFRVAEQQAKSA